MSEWNQSQGEIEKKRISANIKQTVTLTNIKPKRACLVLVYRFAQTTRTM